MCLSKIDILYNYQELPEYEMRKLFIDLEALQFRAGDGPENALRPNDPRDNQEINVIGAYDSYTKTYYQWCMHPNFDESGLEIVEKEGDSIQSRDLMMKEGCFKTLSTL